MEQQKIAIPNLIFPDEISFEDYGGQFHPYFEAVYKIFENDFVKTQAKYNGVRVSAQKQPLQDGMHRTFYHMTHEGPIEDDRSGDLSRMRLMSYPRFMIENCPHPDLLVWEKKKEGSSSKRILIYSLQKKYLVVLVERPGYYLLWTAYPVDHSHTHKKLIKEYETYKNAKPAQ